MLKSMLLRSTARITVLAPPGLQKLHRQPMHASKLPHSTAGNGQDSPSPAADDAAGHPGWGRSSSSSSRKSLHAVLGLGTRLGHNRSTKHLKLLSSWAADRLDPVCSRASETATTAGMGLGQWRMDIRCVEGVPMHCVSAERRLSLGFRRS